MVPGNASGVNSILREHRPRYESSVKMQVVRKMLPGAGSTFTVNVYPEPFKLRASSEALSPPEPDVVYVWKGGAWRHNRMLREWRAYFMFWLGLVWQVGVYGAPIRVGRDGSGYCLAE